jgi:AcrR family transcriptional regulator
VAAAARLYAERGVGNVSLEDVAAAAACTVQAIYGQLGGRDALLVAVAERYSPMPAIAHALADPPADLTTGTRLLYQRIMESVFGEPPVVLALVAEMLSRPGGALADYVTASYAPRAGALLRGWLRPYVESGQIRPLPQVTLASLFVGPMVMVNLTRIIRNAPLAGPERDAVVTDLADAFVRAVSTA